MLAYTFFQPDQVPSTQAYLLSRLRHETLTEGTVVITSHQSSGTGQAGNTWESEPGKNITCSILLRPTFLDPSEQFRLYQMISLAVHGVVAEILPDKKVSIKWPNDIYIENRKTAGILITTAVMGSQLEYAVIGIGLNINQIAFINAGPNPTSLALESGKAFQPESILEMLLASIHQYYTLLQHDNLRLAGLYHNVLYQIHQWNDYRIHGEAMQARILGIGEGGRLMLETRNREIIECDIREIEYL